MPKLCNRLKQYGNIKEKEFEDYLIDEEFLNDE